ncbi:MAG TPA: glycoside hydrolase domain-containing protein [Flavitalea sp.]|nr:glycoside hydrolase domain-containing protein [Flavitalea sp.]
MKKLIFASGIALFFSIHAFSQTQQGRINASLLPALGAHYQEEYDFDVTTNEQAWTSQPHGLQASFGSTEESYFRKDVPVITKEVKKQVTGWRGERINIQVLIWSPDTLLQVRFRPNSLVNEKGNRIDSSNIHLNLVRYVLSNYPYGAKDAVCGNTPYKDGYLMPDRFESFDRFDLPGKTTRPVWLTLQIPADAEPGVYNGIVEVITVKDKQPLSISVRVQSNTLPPPSEWKHLLDLWQNPWAVAWYNHVEPWSEEHKILLKKHLQLYADAGGKYITTYAVHSPWADNSYMIEGGMIEWIKQKDNSWKFDYSIFDDYVELAMQYGINKAITIYTPLPWAERFRYKSAETGNYTYERWVPESKEFKTNWHIFLTDLKKHLEQKGWLKIAYLGINENTMKQTLAAIKVLKQHSPEWRITYAGDWHKELDTLLNDYSYLYGKEPTQEELKKRAARGASSTFYVCCNPPYPNNFVFSPPIEGRWISWYSAACGYDGFLRWAYDAWPADPERDARHGSWAAGDCYLVYPGGNSCIRYEKLREGIVDFEKIRILKEKAAASKDKSVKDLWNKLEQHLKVFKAEKTFDQKKITADVFKGKELMDQISDKLNESKG